MFWAKSMQNHDKQFSWNCFCNQLLWGGRGATLSRTWEDKFLGFLCLAPKTAITFIPLKQYAPAPWLLAKFADRLHIRELVDTQCIFPCCPVKGAVLAFPSFRCCFLSHWLATLLLRIVLRCASAPPPSLDSREPPPGHRKPTSTATVCILERRLGRGTRWLAREGFRP